MSETLTAMQSTIVLIVALVLQYVLVKRPQKWMSFFLPAIYVVVSVVAAFQTVQNGELFLGGLIGTVLFSLFLDNIPTLMLLVIWWKRGSDISTTVIAVFAVYILMNMLFLLLALAVGFAEASISMRIQP